MCQVGTGNGGSGQLSTRDGEAPHAARRRRRPAAAVLTRPVVGLAPGPGRAAIGLRPAPRGVPRDSTHTHAHARTGSDGLGSGEDPSMLAPAGVTDGARHCPRAAAGQSKRNTLAPARVAHATTRAHTQYHHRATRTLEWRIAYLHEMGAAGPANRNRPVASPRGLRGADPRQAAGLMVGRSGATARATMIDMSCSPLRSSSEEKDFALLCRPLLPPHTRER